MHKLTQFVYYSVLLLVTLFVAYMTTVLAISPKKDAEDRGFIGCTKQLVADIGLCEKGSVFCVLGVIWDDTVCNTKVVGSGFVEWIHGKQCRPWDNYLFVPKFDTADFPKTDVYDGDAESDISELHEQNRFLQEKHDELEAAKQRVFKLNPDVLTPEYEGDDTGGVAFDKMPQEFENADLPQDIKDEADWDNEKDMEESKNEN